MISNAIMIFELSLQKVVNMKHTEDAYAEKPSKEFLEELVERARRLGWGCDYTELGMIVEKLHREAGIEFQMPEPYEDEDS